MNKIKLKIKENKTEPLVCNLQNLNFSFGLVAQEQNNINITFYSQHQVERFLNITKLEKYNIKNFIENFLISGENVHKIGFIFSFSANEVDIINDKLKNYLSPMKS